MRKIRFLTIIVLALSLVVLGSAFAAEEAAEEAPKIFAKGMTASDLKLKNAEGQAVDLATEMKGKKKVIVFMNTACSACKTELSHVQSVVQGTPAELIVVSVDFGPFDRVMGYKETAKFAGTWYQDEDFNVPAKFGFDFTPAMVVLDAENKVLMSTGGYNKRKAKAFEKELKGVL